MSKNIKGDQTLYSQRHPSLYLSFSFRARHGVWRSWYLRGIIPHLLPGMELFHYQNRVKLTCRDSISTVHPRRHLALQSLLPSFCNDLVGCALLYASTPSSVVDVSLNYSPPARRLPRHTRGRGKRHLRCVVTGHRHAQHISQITFIWTERWGVGKVLFLATRYGQIIKRIFNVVYVTPTKTPWTVPVRLCHLSYFFLPVSNLTSLASTVLQGCVDHRELWVSSSWKWGQGHILIERSHDWAVRGPTSP